MFSIRAVDRFSVSAMAPRAALRVRLPNRRSTSATSGTPSSTTMANCQSLKNMKTMVPISISRFWV